MLLAGASLLSASGDVQALGFGRSVNASHLGQPLNFAATVRLESDESLPRECVTAEVLSGDFRVAPAAVRVSVEPAPNPGERLVRVTTTTAIDEANLAIAYRAFAAQKGLEGRVISILPRFVLVPPGKRSVEARKQVTATTPGSTAEVNTFAGRLEVVEEPRLIPAGGNDPWFLAADPSRIDTVEYAYLDGQEGVFTETRTGFEVDGIEIKARHDFAAKAIDWRGLFKNAGAA